VHQARSETTGVVLIWTGAGSGKNFRASILFSAGIVGSRHGKIRCMFQLSRKVSGGQDGMLSGQGFEAGVNKGFEFFLLPCEAGEGDHVKRGGGGAVAADTLEQCPLRRLRRHLPREAGEENERFINPSSKPWLSGRSAVTSRAMRPLNSPTTIQPASLPLRPAPAKVGCGAYWPDGAAEARGLRWGGGL
jgi:hypothetical protein